MALTSTITQLPGSQASGTGPLAVLDNSQYSLATYSYPMQGLGQDDVPSYVMFNINLPVTSKYFSSGNVQPDNFSASAQNYDVLAKQGSGFTGITGTQSATNAGVGAIIGGIQGFTDSGTGVVGGAVIGGATLGAASVLSESINIKPQTSRISTSIALYFPDTVLAQYEHSYETVNLTDALGKVGLGAAIGGNLQGLKNTGTDLFNTIRSNFSRGTGSVYNNAPSAEAAGFLANATGQVGAGFTDLTLKSAGKAINPQIQLTFQGTSNRVFIFDFDFIPRSSNEAQQIFNIISTFKTYAAAEIASEGNGRYFIPPGTFDIKFYFQNQEHPYINRISTCVLFNIAVNYAGAGQYSTFTDGFPTHIKMQLQFKETDIITRELISAKGY